MKIYFKKYIVPIAFVALLVWLLANHSAKIDAILFLMVGLALIFLGLYTQKANRRMQIDGIRTKAQITDIVEQQSKDRYGNTELDYYPIVSFTDKNGNKTTQKLGHSTNPERINEHIDIFYLQRGKEIEILVDTAWQKTYYPLIYLLIGLSLTALAIAMLLKTI